MLKVAVRGSLVARGLCQETLEVNGRKQWRTTDFKFPNIYEWLNKVSGTKEKAFLEREFQHSCATKLADFLFFNLNEYKEAATVITHQC